MHAVSSLCTPRELVRALRRTGKKITLNEVSREKFESRKYRNEQEPMVWDMYVVLSQYPIVGQSKTNQLSCVLPL